MFKHFFKYSLIVFTAGLLTGLVGCEDDSEALLNKIDGSSSGKHITVISFGHPNVSKAEEDPDIQIGNLKINGRSGLSYSYVDGDLSVWGLAYNNAGALAVAGYEEDGKFYCAKFDWISSSRRTRDFANINSGYNGWQPEKFYGAKKRCFFIMSADGKKRTNIITD